MIKIDESRYRLLQKQARTNLGKEKLDEFAEAVLNGTALPKGHGDLIDRKELLKLPIDKANYPSNYVKFAHTIIEADKGE